MPAVSPAIKPADRGDFCLSDLKDPNITYEFKMLSVWIDDIFPGYKCILSCRRYRY
jgi:hypothetical protein